MDTKSREGCFVLSKLGRLVLLVCAAAVSVAAAAVPILDADRIQETTLENGLRVIVKPEPYAPVVALGLVIRAGSAYETDANSGVTHMIEHLLFEDPGDGAGLGPWIEDMGGYINASTWRDSTRIVVAVASEFLPEVLPRLAEAVFEAQFTDEQVTRQRRIIIREMADRYAGVDQVLEKLTWETAFTQHPYKRPIPGTPESVERLTREEVEAFYRRFYVPANTALLAVGDVATEEFTRLAASSFGGYAAGDLAGPQLPAEPAQTTTRIAAQPMETKVTFLQFAWHAPGLAAPADVWAMDLMYIILGEGEGGWLNKHVRQQRLALSCGVRFLTQRDPGLFVILAVTPPDKELAARQAILENIERLRTEPLSKEALWQAKRLLYAQYAFTNEAYTDQIETLGFYEAIASYKLATEYIERVNEVTAADVQAVAEKYLAPDQYTLVIIRAPAKESVTMEARLR